MQIVRESETVRNYTEDTLTMQQISDVLWSAISVNRSQNEHRHSSFPARNAQQIEVYAFLESGIYFCDSTKQELVLIKAGDHRKDVVEQEQEFAQKAPPLVLVFVAKQYQSNSRTDGDNRDISPIDVGFAIQNVYLYCVSEELTTVVLSMIDREKIAKLISLKNGKVILGQAVGKTVR